MFELATLQRIADRTGLSAFYRAVDAALLARHARPHQWDVLRHTIDAPAAAEAQPRPGRPARVGAPACPLRPQFG